MILTASRKMELPRNGWIVLYRPVFRALSAQYPGLADHKRRHTILLLAHARESDHLLRLFKEAKVMGTTKSTLLEQEIVPFLDGAVYRSISRRMR